MTTEEYTWQRPDGTMVKGGRVKLLAAAAGQMKSGTGPFTLVRDNWYRHPRLTRAPALKMLAKMVTDLKIGDHLHIERKDGATIFQCHRTQNAVMYRNPLRDCTGLRGLREDEGVDYSVTHDSPLYAIGPGEVITYRKVTGWPGAGGARNGSYIAVKFTEGPARGLSYYYAENITLNASLHVGSKVDSGTRLATLHPAFANCELGWDSGTPGYDTPAANTSPNHYSEGQRCALGVNFDLFMKALGAPAGLTEGRSISGSVPSKYPRSWKDKV